MVDPFTARGSPTIIELEDKVSVLEAQIKAMSTSIASLTSSLGPAIEQSISKRLPEAAAANHDTFSKERSTMVELTAELVKESSERSTKIFSDQLSALKDHLAGCFFQHVAKLLEDYDGIVDSRC